MGTLRQAWVDYRDESFILQFLSPKLMRDFRLFAVHDDAKESAMDVAAIHTSRAIGICAAVWRGTTISRPRP